MTSLASYPRDLTLPAIAGEPDLILPDSGELIERFQSPLTKLLGSPAVSAKLLHARWKPAVAVAGSYRVYAADGTQQIVNLKPHRGQKGAARLAGNQGASAFPGATPNEILFTPEADPELPGLGLALGDEASRRVARLCRESGLLGESEVRKRPTLLTLLRYKPERRAVLRIDLKTRGAKGLRGECALALRVLPPDRAALLAATRRALAAASNPNFIPSVAFHDARTGWLAEPWLDGEVDEVRAYGQAKAVGRLIRGLHDLPLQSDAGPRNRGLDLAPLGVDRDLSLRAMELAALLDERSGRHPGQRLVLGHGDLHADQVILREGQPVALVDLDELGPTTRGEDLSTWVADRLAAAPAAGFEAAAADLLAGYGDLDMNRLIDPVARQLLRLAAAAPRRLEQGAVARAGRLITTVETLLRS